MSPKCLLSTFHIPDPAVNHRDCAKRFDQHVGVVLTEKAQEEPEGEEDEGRAPAQPEVHPD